VDHPVHRAAALAFLLGAAILVWAPLVGTGPRPISSTLAAALGAVLALPVAALVLGGGIADGLAAGLALGGFVMLLSGLAAGAGRLLGRGAAGLAVAAGVGTLLLASFHIGDPVLEWGGAGSHSPAALTALHVVNPASGAVGDGLGLDWLRAPIMYSGFPGTAEDGLSAAQYYLYSYTPWWGTAAAHGGAGLLLLLAALGRSGIRLPRDRGRT
jgi:hypothetical protein